MRRRWWLPAWLFVALFVSACAEPPNKEMDQAQSAIDAARMAGADRYAADDYNAAVSALARSRDAVSVKDYRLALNHALDARSRAQTAAHTAAETKARLRTDIERTLADLNAALADARARLAAAEKTRAARRRLRPSSAALTSIDKDVQKAGKAWAAEDYSAAEVGLKNIGARITEVNAQIEKAAAPTVGRGRR
jgi:hypothetical protein